MARESDFYILILGGRYGDEVFPGKSATEVEFDAAYKNDPTKILVFLKEANESIEQKQRDFIERITKYKSGYLYNSYKYTHELSDMIKKALIDLIIRGI